MAGGTPTYRDVGETGPAGADGPTGATGATGPAHVTTAGDIEYHNGTTATRLPVGTNGQVLQVNTSLAGKLAWGNLLVAFAVSDPHDLTQLLDSSTSPAIAVASSDTIGGP